MMLRKIAFSAALLSGFALTFPAGVRADEPRSDDPASNAALVATLNHIREAGLGDDWAYGADHLGRLDCHAVAGDLGAGPGRA